MASPTVYIQTIAKVGLPALQGGKGRSNSNRLGAVTGTSRTGLRLNSDRLALKSAFYNGGSAIALVETESSAGGGSRINMRVASKGAYICKDCGYIYNDRTPFEKLSSDYSCPVCAAPKRRFKPYEAPVARNANDQSIRKARKAGLKQADAAVGSALPIAIVVGVAALIGIFVYVNSI